MKQKLTFKSYAMIFCLISAVSCTDILDQEPVNITHPAVFWTSQANAEQAVAGGYALFKEALLTDGCFLYWGEWTGMTFMNSREDLIGFIEDRGGDFNIPYRESTRNWRVFFRAANWAFTIEKYVEDMPVSMFKSQSAKDDILGQAAFIRSISYFYMARIWGDVPIVEQSLESSDQLVTKDGFIIRNPRENELKVLDYALEAANKAIGLMEYASPADSDWAITANKASAEALKAHITLWYAGRDNDNNEMIQQAITATTSVINNSNASLIDYVNEGEDGFNGMCLGQSKTGLFEINVSASMNESFRLAQAQDTHTGVTLNYPVWANVDSRISPFMDPEFYGNAMMANDPDRANDVRLNLFFHDYFTDPDYSYLLKYSQSEQDPASEDPYAQFSDSNLLIFRLADMYLLRAEANARLAIPGAAVSDLNAIRSKANVPDYTGATDRASLFKAIFDERAIEFVGEAQSGYDRIRMDYYEGVPWENAARKAKKGYFWPVDPSITSINPSILQTEFWRGKL